MKSAYPTPETVELQKTYHAGRLLMHFKDLCSDLAGVPQRGRHRRLGRTIHAAKKGNEAAPNQLKELHARIIVERSTK